MYIRSKFLDYNEVVFAYSSSELNKIVLKSLLSSSDFSFLFRIYFFFLLQSYPRFSSFSYFSSFCCMNGYSKSVFRLFKMSSHNSSKYASLGLMSGMRKSSF